MSDVVWTPDAATIEHANATRLVRRAGVESYEELVRRSRDESKAPEPAAAGPRTPSASARDLAMRLTRTLGTRVEVLEVGKERGQIAIHYHSLDQLDALLERLMQS